MKNNINKFQSLDNWLDQFKKLTVQNKKNITNGKNDYSLINSLLKINDEVRLHSRFIYSMLNPSGLHYQNDAFLKLFLNELPAEFDKFKNQSNWNVFREKGNIDLLIHNNEYYIIIENKINAPDQYQQITRYINFVKTRFDINEEEIGKKVAVIYLSHKKKHPTSKSKSIEGFGLERANGCNIYLKWQNKAVTINEDELTLKNDTKLPYCRMSYLNSNESNISVSHWVDKCICEVQNVTNLKHAFQEYRLILDRLDKNKTWRKQMTISDYVLNKKDAEQQEYYELMAENQKCFFTFISKYIYKALINTFKNELGVDFKEEEFSGLDASQIEKWLKADAHKKNYKNQGFTCSHNDAKLKFAFGTKYVYLGVVDSDEYGDFYVSKNIVLKEDIRKKLINNTCNSDQTALEEFIKAVEEKLKNSF